MHYNKVGCQVTYRERCLYTVDGKAPSIACATTGGKILIHSPHEALQSGQTSAIRYLNLNRKITALAAGTSSWSKVLFIRSLNFSKYCTGTLAQPDADHRPDFLFVGSESNLLGYDIERNADAFFVDVQDGVHSLVVGKVGNTPKPLVIAGGNCSVLGFDGKGTESCWTVTGDNVSAIALCDLQSNGQPLLLVGSDDFEIRVFQQEELLSEITEADKVTLLNPVGSAGKFAYGLANGTVGVYTGVNSRLWRVKTKNKVTALASYDLDMDGVPEVFSGWDNGSFTVRREENGEVVFRQAMDAPIAAILKADYRMDGKEEVMICSEAGEVRAYLASDVDLSTIAGTGLAGKDTSADQKALAELQEQKLELLAEMKLLERSMKATAGKEVPVGMLPPGTSLQYTVEGDLKLGAVALKVEVNSDCQIMNLIAVDLGELLLAVSSPTFLLNVSTGCYVLNAPLMQREWCL
jgi:Bardet-Biedl syndrome 2 protein